MGALLLFLQVLNAKSEFFYKNVSVSCGWPCSLACKLKAPGIKKHYPFPFSVLLWLHGILGKETEDQQILPTLQKSLYKGKDFYRGG